MKSVIISHNQKDCIIRMAESMRGMPCIFILDRCTDGSKELCEKLYIPFIESTEGSGRQCSRARNIGADHFKGDDIVFFDGDRIPNFDPKLLDRSPFDVTLVKSSEDIRDDFSKSWEPEKFWGSYRNGVFGSCVMVRSCILEKVMNRYGYLFDTDFTLWGEEDRHFGDLCFSVGATCGFADDSWRVSGRATICHERMDEFRAMSVLRVKKLIALGLEYLINDPIA